MGKSKELAELGNITWNENDGRVELDGSIRLGTSVSSNRSLDFSDSPDSDEKWAIYGWGDQLQFSKRTSSWGWASTPLAVDASGRVTMPYQPHISGSPRNTTNAGLANAFTTRTTPVGLSFSNDRITVPIAGVYHISFNTISSEASNVRTDARIHINGVETCNSLTETNTSGYKFRSLSLSVQLAANDYIQFYNQDWYNFNRAAYEPWRTASVTL